MSVLINRTKESINKSKTAKDLNQTETWFRDNLYKIAFVGWLPVLVSFTNWLLSGKDTFLRWNLAGIALAVFIPLIYTIWASTTWWCYSHCPDHLTVPKKFKLIGYMMIIGIFLFVSVLLALDYFD